ncbi:MAG: prephenate dehydrogenase [Candidatus Micrarchaeia archaeon]|jgi:prephenate dehydrogenase
MKKVAIIGFGAFGKLTASHLAGKYEVVVADSKQKPEDARKLGVRQVPIEDAAKADFIVLCVPISQMQDALKEIAPNIRPGALVLDTCSVKVLPCRLMESMLPSEVEVIGTHPLFGPQSAGNGIRGQQITVCPVRSKRTEKVCALLKELGLDVVRLTADEHDRLMASTQAITHFVGRALAKISPKDAPARLKSHERMMAAAEMVRHDSDQLFADIETLNPYAKQERRKLLAELERMEKGFGK